MRVAIDVDGVLADFTAAFIKVVNSIHPGRVEEGYEPDDWGWTKRLSPKEMDRCWEAVRETPNWWLGLRPYPEEVALVREWVRPSIDDVYFVTSRISTGGNSALHQTAEWLRSWVGGESWKCGVVVKPSGGTKAAIYKALGIEFSIDDYPKNARQCLFLDIPGKHFLLDRPWNRDAKALDKVRLGKLEDFFAKLSEAG